MHTLTTPQTCAEMGLLCSQPLEDRPAEISVVDHYIGDGDRVDLLDVQSLSGEIAVAVHGLSLLCAAFPIGIARSTSSDGQLGVDVHPDAQVPAAVQSSAEREDPIDDENAVVGHVDSRLEWSSWVTGSMQHSTTRPEPSGAVGSSNNRRAAFVSNALR